MHKYLAINWIGGKNWGKAWVESTNAEDNEDAESILARNNPQVFLREEEAKEVLKELSGELYKGKEKEIATKVIKEIKELLRVRADTLNLKSTQKNLERSIKKILNNKE